MANSPSRLPGPVTRSLAPPTTPPERRATLVGHSVVNGLGTIAIAAMHIWGSVSGELAVGVIAGICGVWSVTTRKGPPAATGGVVGVLTSLAELFRR